MIIYSIINVVKTKHTQALPDILQLKLEVNPLESAMSQVKEFAHMVAVSLLVVPLIRP